MRTTDNILGVTRNRRPPRQFSSLIVGDDRPYRAIGGRSLPYCRSSSRWATGGVVTLGAATGTMRQAPPPPVLGPRCASRMWSPC